MESFGATLFWVGRVSAQASLLVLLILLIQWILRSRLTASWRYALWWVVVLIGVGTYYLAGAITVAPRGQ